LLWFRMDVCMYVCVVNFVTSMAKSERAHDIGEFQSQAIRKFDL